MIFYLVMHKDHKRKGLTCKVCSPGSGESALQVQNIDSVTGVIMH